MATLRVAPLQHSSCKAAAEQPQKPMGTMVVAVLLMAVGAALMLQATQPDDS